jgi:hypothetical protein
VNEETVQSASLHTFNNAEEPPKPPPDEDEPKPPIKEPPTEAPPVKEPPPKNSSYREDSRRFRGVSCWRTLFPPKTFSAVIESSFVPGGIYQWLIGPISREANYERRSVQWISYPQTGTPVESDGIIEHQFADGTPVSRRLQEGPQGRAHRPLRGWAFPRPSGCDITTPK